MDGVLEVVRSGRLRWFGHVERMDAGNWVSDCRGLDVGGHRGKGRPNITWQESVDRDMRELGLCRSMALHRVKWRGSILVKPSDPCLHGKRT